MSKYNLSYGSYDIKPAHIRDIRPDVLGPDGRMRILPAAFWAKTSANERALFGHNTGIYSFPTEELVARLKEIIGDRSAIEIGSGNGVLAEALGIPATDSFQQTQADTVEAYEEHGYVTVPYGPNVEKLTAYDAVRKYDPDVVLGCWVTHKYNPDQPWLKGNEFGVDEADVLEHCEEYVFVGNLKPEVCHTKKPIFQQIHETETPHWIYSRAQDHKREVLIRWKGRKYFDPAD
jgi:hypothetical protein